MKKKWLILILVLAIIGVVLAIVFINLFKVRDTKALSENLLEVTQTGYLASEQNTQQGSQENELIKEYLTNLKTLTGELSQGEVNTISNYLDAYSAFEISVEFFAREMLFADATTTYNTNHGAVEKSLSRAQKNADNLKEYILDVKSKTQGSAYWTASTWTDCKQDLDEMIENSADAVAKLILIYRDSVPNHIEHGGIQNNGFTDIIFDAMTDMMEDISKNSSQDAKFGSGLLQFVSAYLVKENEHVILNYPYNTILQQKVKTIQDNGKTAAEYQGFISGSWVTLYGRV